MPNKYSLPLQRKNTIPITALETIGFWKVQQFLNLGIDFPYYQCCTALKKLCRQADQALFCPVSVPLPGGKLDHLQNWNAQHVPCCAGPTSRKTSQVPPCSVVVPGCDQAPPPNLEGGQESRGPSVPSTAVPGAGLWGGFTFGRVFRHSASGTD